MLKLWHVQVDVIVEEDKSGMKIKNKKIFIVNLKNYKRNILKINY